MPSFTQAGFQAEHILVKQFSGKLISDLSQQYKDIDAVLTNKRGKKRSVSVKDQLGSSRKFGGIQIETLLTNTRNGATRNGCFLENAADDYFWRVHTEEHGDTWLIIRCNDLKAYVEANEGSLRKWTTKHYTEEKNRRLGRTYDRAQGVTIPVAKIIKEARVQLIPVESHTVH